MEAGTALAERIAGVDRHVSAVARDQREVRDTVNRNTGRISVVESQVQDIRDDIAEVKAHIAATAEAQRESNNRVIVALIGFAITVAGSAITVALTVGGTP